MGRVLQTLATLVTALALIGVSLSAHGAAPAPTPPDPPPPPPPSESPEDIAGVLGTDATLPDEPPPETPEGPEGPDAADGEDPPDDAAVDGAAPGDEPLEDGPPGDAAPDDPAPDDPAPDDPAPGAPTEDAGAAEPPEVDAGAPGEDEPGAAEPSMPEVAGIDRSIGVVDLADPMGPIEAALDSLALQAGVKVGPRERSVVALRGETLTTTIEGAPGDLLQYVLGEVAYDGYQILLEPIAPDTFQLIALQARTDEGLGVALVLSGPPKFVGEFRRGESPETLEKLVSVPRSGVLPVALTRDLERLGYRASFRAVAQGEVEISVVPGRAIRRVEVHGHIPLSEREVRRVLSFDARPGALARGQCVPKARLVRGQRPSLCAPGDLACQAWRDAEVARIERFLFDEGYLRGTAALALQCGRPGVTEGRKLRSTQEVVLHVYLNKGPAYRVRAMKVYGNLSTQDQRWIRRVFRPSIGPLGLLPKRVTRRHLEDARERAAAEYAEPRSGPGAARRQLELPYPGVRVETNYDELRDAEQPPPGNKLPLEIDVQLGEGVQTAFVGNDHIGSSRLEKQLQLWARREPATTTTAEREARNLRTYYQSRGFLLAEVTGKFQDFGTLGKLRFDVKEGPRIRVRDVDLVRPDGVPEVVMDAIEQAWRGQREIAPRGRFTDAGGRTDLGAVLAAFAEHGYLCATAELRVAFWESGLDEPGAYAVLDPLSELTDTSRPAWLINNLEPRGLAGLKKEARAGLYVRLQVEPGPRVVTSGRETVRHLEVPIPASRTVRNLPELAGGDWGAPRMLREGPLRRSGDERAGGIPLQLTLDREVELDVIDKYRAAGYPVADVEVRWRVETGAGEVSVAQTERLTDPAVGLCRAYAGERVAIIDTELFVYEGKRGVFGTTLVRGNFKTRAYVIKREAEYDPRNPDRPRPWLKRDHWVEGGRYDATKVEGARRRIEGIGVTESVQIEERYVDCDLYDDGPCVVHEIVNVTESKDRSLDVSGGLGGATLDPFYVFLRPTFPNIGGFGWDLALDGHLGANIEGLNSAFCSGEDCYERSARASFVHRRIFGLDPTVDFTGQIQRRVTPARGQIDSALGQARLTWPFRFDRSGARRRVARRERSRIFDDELRVYAGYIFQVANISKDLVKPTLGPAGACPGGDPCRPPNRGEAIVPDVTGGGQVGLSWERVDNPFNPSDGFIASFDGMIASPWLGGRDWWIRGDASFQHYVPVPATDDRLNFRYWIRYGQAIPLPGLPGAETASIPEVWRYFGGGTTDLGLRGIEPQTMLVDIERVQGPHGAVTLRPVAQGGHIRALATVALQVVSVKNFLGGQLAHSGFVDLGVLTQRWSQVRLGRDLRRSIGTNFIKWDINIVTVSLGYAILIPNWIFPGNVRPTDDINGRFVFDVGATF